MLALFIPGFLKDRLSAYLGSEQTHHVAGQCALSAARCGRTRMLVRMNAKMTPEAA
jgi:hypothetical protein